MLYKNFIVIIFALFLSNCGTERSPQSLMVHTTYGDFKITEPVLINLFRSSAMERLKHIRQYGSLDYFAGDPHYSRYEHSVGVWALLRHYGASLDEQIAGLLHDASHTVFSHVGDHLFGSDILGNSYQDNCTIRTKFRGYNPWIKTNNGLARLTDIDPEFCAIYNGAKQVITQGWPVRWIQPALFE